MIISKYVKTSKQNDKKTINLSNHDNKNNRWTKQFISYDLKIILQKFKITQLIDKNNMFYKFQLKCKEKGIECI